MKSTIVKLFLLTSFAFLGVVSAGAQDMNALVMKVKAKLDKVKDYTADGKMKTDVAFIKAPIGKVKVFFKSPDKFKLQRDGGISVLPKGGVSINIGSMVMQTGFVAIDAGMSTVQNLPVRVVKLLPNADAGDIILSTLYIDEQNLLIRKSVTTTRENGTYEMELIYGKYDEYGLPDKVIFSFNAKDYKLPKGITLEFDDTDKAIKDKMKGRKGRVEINYSSYTINTGLSNSIFNNQ
ncbi:LolA family protein [Sediminibacterium sp.]|uniref:LolA family protein n=1 Tax=Sediminibacterium sp. TaxID=1917865 RepID=UPI003F696C81